MNNKCTLEYLAEEMKKIVDLTPIPYRCHSCSDDNRCHLYMPVKRIQNVKDGDKLYRRKYR